jgi:hypothetical protein
LEDLGIGCKKIEWLSENEGVRGLGLDSSGSRQGPDVGSGEHGNELSVFIKGRKCLN